MTETNAAPLLARGDGMSPFYRGDEPSSYCDHLADGADQCCDREDPKYLVTWKNPDQGAFSSVCEEHAVLVDRNIVASIRTAVLAGEPRD